MPVRRLRGSPYSIPTQLIGVNRRHPLADRLRSLYFPGVTGGQRRLYNLAPEPSRTFIQPYSATNVPAVSTTPFGPVSAHNGAAGGGMFQAAHSLWDPPVTSWAEAPGTIACMGVIDGAPTGYPSLYSLTGTAAYLAFAPTNTDLLFSVGRSTNGGVEPSMGTWTAGHVYLMIAGTNGAASHYGYLLNLTTGVQNFFNNTTDAGAMMGGAQTADTWENIGGADYGSQFYLNGRVGMTAFWSRQLSVNEMQAFLASPWDMMLEPAGRVSRGATSGGTSYSSSGEDSIALGDSGLSSAVYPCAGADGLTLADSGTGLRVLSSSASDAVVLVESSSATANRVGSAADAITLGENSAAAATRVGVSSDAITLGEAHSSSMIRSGSASDTVTLADSGTGAIGAVTHDAAATDGVTLQDAATSNLAAPVVASDAITLGDTAASSLGPVTYDATGSDSVILGESVSVSKQTSASGGGSVSLADSAVAQRLVPGLGQDAITLLDSAQASAVWSDQVSDGILLADSAASSGIWLVSADDSVLLLDRGVAGSSAVNPRVRATSSSPRTPSPGATPRTRAVPATPRPN